MFGNMGLMGMLMGGGEGSTGQNNDMMTMMLYQQMMGGNGDSLSDNKRFQMFLFAPIGKKFLAKIANQIQMRAQAEGKPLARAAAELLASDIVRDLEEEQEEGDLKQILHAARMSVRMGFLGSSGIEVGGNAQQQAAATGGQEASTLGHIGGYVTGRLEEQVSPIEELEEVMGAAGKKEEKLEVTAKKTAKSLRGLI